ncbi:MAG: hypothetical protein ABR909_10025 [Candidatus Bathyarchaeia archaeon]|jgi:membrane-bound ClpP family serine protease
MNTQLTVVGIILMIIGALMFSSAFNYIVNPNYVNGIMFGSVNGIIDFALFGFMVFVVGLIITEKEIIEYHNRLGRSLKS